MPARPLRPCNRSGCRVLVRPPARYCPAHDEQARQHRVEADRYYDQHHRDPKVVEFYKSPAWRALRLRVLERDHWLCQRCLRNGRLTRANTVHHLVPITEDWSRRLDVDNCESICPACHNAEHGARGGVCPPGGSEKFPSAPP